MSANTYPLACQKQKGGDIIIIIIIMMMMMMIMMIMMIIFIPAVTNPSYPLSLYLSL